MEHRSVFSVEMLIFHAFMLLYAHCSLFNSDFHHHHNHPIRVTLTMMQALWATGMRAHGIDSTGIRGQFYYLNTPVHARLTGLTRRPAASSFAAPRRARNPKDCNDLDQSCHNYINPIAWLARPHALFVKSCADAQGTLCIHIYDLQAM